MKKMINILTLLVLISNICLAQDSTSKEIKMTSQYLSENQDISDLMYFKGIAFYKLQFRGEQLKGATFKLVAKEIWEGEITNETLVTNSADIDHPSIAQIQDSTFSMKLISELTSDNELKMAFKFPRYGREMKFKATNSEDYSLRNIPEVTANPIILDKPFYLFAYILPYEVDGAKYWCAVEGSGKDIEQWGNEFGIKHYLLIEMTFESPKGMKNKNTSETK